jgi:hypothetical protein
MSCSCRSCSCRFKGTQSHPSGFKPLSAFDQFVVLTVTALVSTNCTSRKFWDSSTGTNGGRNPDGQCSMYGLQRPSLKSKCSDKLRHH